MAFDADNEEVTVDSGNSVTLAKCSSVILVLWKEEVYGELYQGILGHFLITGHFSFPRIHKRAAQSLALYFSPTGHQHKNFRFTN